MGDSYGAAYTTRSADEGYGERYGEAVKAVLEKKAQKEGNMKEAQRGATSERDASADAGTQSLHAILVAAPSFRNSGEEFRCLIISFLFVGLFHWRAKYLKG
jgi:hypothetical protein